MKLIKIKLIGIILFIIFIVGCNGSGWQAISYSDPPSSGGLSGTGLILNQQELDVRGYVAELYFSDPIDIQGQIDGNWVSVTTTNLGLPQMNPNALITFTNSDNAAISFTAAWDPNTLTDDDSAAPALKIYAPCTIPTGTYKIAFNTSGVRRHSDQAMDGSTYSVIFKVVNPNTDTQNPYITYTFPQNGSSLFNPHGTLILQFSKPLGNLLGSSTPDMNNLSLSSPDNQNLTASIANGFNIGTTYTITIVSNTDNALIDYMPYTQDVDGNPLTVTDYIGPHDYVWTFTTSGISISASSPSELNYTNAKAVLSFSGSALTTVTGITIGGNIPNGVATYISSDGSFTTSSFRLFDGQGYTVSVCATISSGYDGGCDTIVVNASSGAPASLNATGGNNYITLQWQASTESNVSGYNVYRGTSSLGPYQQIASSVNSLEYNDASVVTNTTYYYAVTTVDSDGNESGYSNEVNAYAGTCASPTYVSTNINTNTAWRLCGSPYIVTSNIYVYGNNSSNPAILTIDPGVAVEFSSGTSLQIGYSTSQPGGLMAMGEPDHLITFTGTTSGQIWQGITFYYATANSLISSSIVSGSIGVGLNLISSSVPITDSTIFGNGGYGISLSTSSPTITDSVIENGIYTNDTSSIAQLSDDTFINYNSNYYMIQLPMESLLNASGLVFSGTDSSSFIGFVDNSALVYGGELKNLGIPYYTSNTAVICGASGLVNVTVDYGVIWEFGSGSSLQIGNSGNHCGEFAVNGATFTGSGWLGINFYNATSASVFNGTVYGINANYHYQGALILNSSPIQITGSTIIGNSNFGIVLKSSNATITNSVIQNGIAAYYPSIPQLTNDTFINYNGIYMLELPMESLFNASGLVFSGTDSSSSIVFASENTLAYGGELKDLGVPYSGGVNICGTNGLVTVTVDHGVVWENANLVVGNPNNGGSHCGELVVNGVTFTGGSQIRFYYATSASVFRGSIYSTGGWNNYPLMLNFSSIVITGSTIIATPGYSGYSVYLNNSSPTIADSAMQGGVYTNDASSVPQLSYDTFINYNGSNMILVPMESMLNAIGLVFSGTDSSSYIGFTGNNSSLAYGGELKNFRVPYFTPSGQYNTICGVNNSLVTVTLDYGVVWEFGSNSFLLGSSLYIGSSGYHCGELVANGATFTGTNWNGISFSNATSASVFSGTIYGAVGTIYGGGTNNGLTLNSSSILITNSTIAGNGEYGINLNSSNPTIFGSTITGNGGNGINLSSSRPTIENSVIEHGVYTTDLSSIAQLSNDRFVNYYPYSPSTPYMIQLPMESLLTATNLTFTNFSSTSYIGFVSNNSTLAYGGELKSFGVPYSTTSSYNTICGGSNGLVTVTVDNGVTWEFGNNDYLTVGSSTSHCGELVANGATFTGTNWNGINFYNATSASAFNGTVSGSNGNSSTGALQLVSSPIVITGSTIIGNSGHGIYLSNSSRPTIENSVIEHGVYTTDLSSIAQLSNDRFVNYYPYSPSTPYMIQLPMESLLTATNLTFTNFSSTSYIGFVSNNSTLAYGGELKSFGVPYSTTSSYNTICGGSNGLVTVTVDNGVTWEFGNYDSLTVGSSTSHCGELVANGATFTGGTGTGWNGITFYKASMASMIKNSLIYGGNGSSGNGSIYLSSSSIQITGSTIQNSPGNGIYCYNSTPLLWGNTISFSANYGIYLGSCSPIIEYNTIASNKYGVYASSSPLTLYHNNIVSNVTQVTNSYPSYAYNVDARFNWWGSHLTPTSISQGVSFNPWLGEPVGGDFSVTDVFISSNPYAVNSLSSTSISVNLNLNATSQLVIIPANEDPLSGNAINEFTQTGQNFTVSWNGTDFSGQTVTTGAYYFSITSTSGSLSAVPIIGTINVVSSAPVAYISSPSNNQVFSTSAGIPVSGIAYMYPTSGFSYTLEVGVGDAPQSWNTVSFGSSTVGGLPATYGSLGTITTSNFKNGGIYTVRLTVTNGGITSRYMQSILVLYTYGWSVYPWLFSPENSSGAPNTTGIIAYSTVGGASFTIGITDSGNSVVRTLSGTADGSGLITATWDGKNATDLTDVTDGTYGIGGTAYYAGVSSTAVTNATQTTVDNTPPVSSISYPTNGQIVAGTVNISGTAADSAYPIYFKNYYVEVGSGNNPNTYQIICSSSTPVSNGTLCSWNAASYALGNYTLLLYVADDAGNTSTATTYVTMGNLTISNVMRSPVMFNPSTGGSINVSFTINLPATISLNMYPESTGTSGSLISTVSQTFTNPGTYSIPWNGTDFNELPVQDDAYIYTLSGSALAGSSQSSFTAYSPTTTTSLAYTLKTYNYSPYIEYPIINYNPYQNQYPYFVITPNPTTSSDAGKISFPILGYPPGGLLQPLTYLMNNQPFSALSPSYVTYWDGRDNMGNIITPGAYYMQSPLNDIAEVTMRANYVITFGSKPEITGVTLAPPYPQTDPYTITLSYNQFTHLEYSLSMGAYVTITATDSGQQDITIINGQYQPAGVNIVPINFLNASNPEQFTIKDIGGAYTLSITAVNPVNGAITTRRTTINISP